MILFMFICIYMINLYPPHQLLNYVKKETYSNFSKEETSNFKKQKH